MAGALSQTLSDPNLAFGAVLLGILGIYCEFVRPGLVAPGVAGGVLALLGISALSTMPLTVAGVALLAAAVLLLPLDAIMGKGWLLSALIAIALATGAGLLIDGRPGIRWPVAIGSASLFGSIAGYLAAIARRARRNKAPVQ